MSATAERFLEAQQALIEALRVEDDGGAMQRASGRLALAYAELCAGPEPGAEELARMKSLAGLLRSSLEERQDCLARELGRTRLALELARKRSRGARPGRRCDVAG